MSRRSEFRILTSTSIPSFIHEEGFIRAFVVPDRRDRFLKLLATQRGRKKLTAQFAHFYDLDPRFSHLLPPPDHSVDAIYQHLAANGASDTCYVMGDSELDGRVVDLREALEEIVGRSFGNFISCIPGRLGYFEGEEPNERYILERKDRGGLTH